MRARADAARHAGRARDAAVLYAEAFRMSPDDGSLLAQCADMFYRAGDYVDAEHHYRAAIERAPNDPDHLLQLGRTYKALGRLDEARSTFNRAAKVRPGWSSALEELAAVRGAPDWVPETGDVLDESAASLLARHDAIDGLPELVASKPRDLLHAHHDHIEIRQLGRRERHHSGNERTLRGIESIRGFCVSAVSIVELQIALDDQLLYRDVVQGYPLKYERDNPTLRKYVFNAWIDFSPFAEGRYTIELRFKDAVGNVRRKSETVVLAAPLSPTDYPDSNNIVTVTEDDRRSIEQQVNAQPSMIRAARRHLLSRRPRNVLVQRADQLGDLVCSIPAIQRLREILPEARIVGLLTPANADLALTLQLFDDIVVIDFPDDLLNRRRVMPLDQQAALRKRLSHFKFDVAIDLSEGPGSRPLLMLSGAPFMFGFEGSEFPWLSAGVRGNTYERLNEHEIVPHTNKVLGVVEWFGAMIGAHSQVIRRTDLQRSELAVLGIRADERFAVLHTGARLPHSRWPFYERLASMILERTGLSVVMMNDDPLAREGLAHGLASSDRFHLFDKRLSFDHFDALVSYAAVFVGNDSGPKHLASLRGTEVVSLHMSRSNWNEWGQENTGVIISRRVPCAGCLIHHDPEECGKGFACMVNIRPEEVFGAVCKLI